MKKVLSLMLLCAMVLTLAACGNTKTETPDAPQQSETVQDDQATILPAPGELTKPAPAPETEAETPAPEQGVVTGPQVSMPELPEPAPAPETPAEPVAPVEPEAPAETPAEPEVPAETPTEPEVPAETPAESEIPAEPEVPAEDPAEPVIPGEDLMGLPTSAFSCVRDDFCPYIQNRHSFSGCLLFCPEKYLKFF